MQRKSGRSSGFSFIGGKYVRKFSDEPYPHIYCNVSDSQSANKIDDLSKTAFYHNQKESTFTKGSEYYINCLYAQSGLYEAIPPAKTNNIVRSRCTLIPGTSTVVTTSYQNTIFNKNRITKPNISVKCNETYKLKKQNNEVIKSSSTGSVSSLHSKPTGIIIATPSSPLILNQGFARSYDNFPYTHNTSESNRVRPSFSNLRLSSENYVSSKVNQPLSGFENRINASKLSHQNQRCNQSGKKVVSQFGASTNSNNALPSRNIGYRSEDSCNRVSDRDQVLYENASRNTESVSKFRPKINFQSNIQSTSSQSYLYSQVKTCTNADIDSKKTHRNTENTSLVFSGDFYNYQCQNVLPDKNSSNKLNTVSMPGPHCTQSALEHYLLDLISDEHNYQAKNTYCDLNQKMSDSSLMHSNNYQSKDNCSTDLLKFLEQRIKDALDKSSRHDSPYMPLSSQNMHDYPNRRASLNPAVHQKCIESSSLYNRSSQPWLTHPEHLNLSVEGNSALVKSVTPHLLNESNIANQSENKMLRQFSANELQYLLKAVRDLLVVRTQIISSSTHSNNSNILDSCQFKLIDCVSSFSSAAASKVDSPLPSRAVLTSRISLGTVRPSRSDSVAVGVQDSRPNTDSKSHPKLPIGFQHFERYLDNKFGPDLPSTSQQSATMGVVGPTEMDLAFRQKDALLQSSISNSANNMGVAALHSDVHRHNLFYMSKAQQNNPSNASIMIPASEPPMSICSHFDCGITDLSHPNNHLHDAQSAEYASEKPVLDPNYALYNVDMADDYAHSQWVTPDWYQWYLASHHMLPHRFPLSLSDQSFVDCANANAHHQHCQGQYKYYHPNHFSNMNQNLSSCRSNRLTSPVSLQIGPVAHDQFVCCVDPDHMNHNYHYLQQPHQHYLYASPNQMYDQAPTDGGSYSIGESNSAIFDASASSEPHSMPLPCSCSSSVDASRRLPPLAPPPPSIQYAYGDTRGSSNSQFGFYKPVAHLASSYAYSLYPYMVGPMRWSHYAHINPDGCNSNRLYQRPNRCVFGMPRSGSANAGFSYGADLDSQSERPVAEFDHLRTTAAANCCYYLNCEPTQTSVLMDSGVGGDSGSACSAFGQSHNVGHALPAPNPSIRSMTNSFSAYDLASYHNHNHGHHSYQHPGQAHPGFGHRTTLRNVKSTFDLGPELPVEPVLVLMDHSNFYSKLTLFIKMDNTKQLPLPSGWSERHSSFGRSYYTCDSTRRSTWNHPFIAPYVPLGWERIDSKQTGVYYQNLLIPHCQRHHPNFWIHSLLKDPEVERKSFFTDLRKLQSLTLNSTMACYTDVDVYKKAAIESEEQYFLKQISYLNVESLMEMLRCLDQLFYEDLHTLVVNFEQQRLWITSCMFSMNPPKQTYPQFTE